MTDAEELELLTLKRKRAMAAGQDQQGGGDPSVFGKAWDALGKVEPLVRKGYKEITDATSPSMEDIETGKASKFGIARRAIGEAATDVLPKFSASRGAIVGGVAGEAIGPALEFASPAINGTGRFLGKTLEAMSGLKHTQPGVLGRAVSDPLRIFAKGGEAANEAYEAVKNPDEILGMFKDKMWEHKDYVNKALELAKKGLLSPEEALEARKSLGEIEGTITEESFRGMRSFFDGIAKVKFRDADQMRARAYDADALRTPFPLTKTGDPAQFRTFAAGVQPWLIPFISPAVQGAGASALGAVIKAGKFLAKPIGGGAAAESANAAAGAFGNIRNMRVPFFH